MKIFFSIAVAISSFFSLFSQNVGIGINTPATPLHIFNSSVSEILRLQGNHPYLSFRKLNGTTTSYVQGYNDDLLIGTILGNSIGDIRFYLNNVERMTILDNGNVGIGTNTPGAPLSFPNLLGNKISFWRTGPNNDFGIGINSGVMQLYTAGHDKIAFGYGNANPDAFTETITFYTGSGQIGLGTTTPQAKLHINQSNEALRLSGDATYLSIYNGDIFKGYVQAYGSDMHLGTPNSNTFGNVHLSIKGTPQLTVQNDGRVRVGEFSGTIQTGSTTDYLPKLAVTGPVGFKDPIDPDGEWAIMFDHYNGEFPNPLSFFFNGGLKAFVDDADGSWETFSDFRLKEEFKDYKSVLDGIKKLEVLTYHFKADKTGKRSFGLVAQNVQQYFPEIVSSCGPDSYMGISYAKTGVLAIKAIQEQQHIIETLEKRIAALESERKKLP